MSAHMEGPLAVVSPTAPLDAPLTAAGNFLAGVTARSRSLAATTNAPEEAHLSMLEGIHDAIEQLTRAATITRALLAEGASDATP